jgi:hypothetical protein
MIADRRGHPRQRRGLNVRVMLNPARRSGEAENEACARH